MNFEGRYFSDWYNTIPLKAANLSKQVKYNHFYLMDLLSRSFNPSNTKATFLTGKMTASKPCHVGVH